MIFNRSKSELPAADAPCRAVPAGPTRWAAPT